MWNNQKQQKIVFPFVYYHFKLDFQKSTNKWLIHGTKRRKDNQLQSLEDKQ